MRELTDSKQKVLRRDWVSLSRHILAGGFVARRLSNNPAKLTKPALIPFLSVWMILEKCLQKEQ